MNRIKKVLEQEFGLAVNHEYENMYASNDTVLSCVIPPHSRNKYKYFVWFSTRAAFDRWSNSRAIEKKFDTVEDVCKYLKENKMEIYEEMLKYLSGEYDELYEEFENELFHRFSM